MCYIDSTPYSLSSFFSTSSFFVFLKLAHCDIFGRGGASAHTFCVKSRLHSHAAELEAVGISLVMRGEVVVVENPDAEHSGVNARAQEEDCDEARHLVERTVNTNQLV